MIHSCWKVSTEPTTCQTHDCYFDQTSSWDTTCHRQMAVAFNGFPRFYSIPCKRHWSLILSSMVDFYTGIYQFQAEVYFRNLWNMHQWSIYTVFTRWLVRQDQTAKETKRRMIIHRFLLFLQVLHDRNRHKSKSQQFEKHYTTKLFHHGDGSFFYCSPISMLRQCFALLCTVTGGSVYLYLLLTCLFIFICWSFLILFFLFFIYRCRKMKKTTNA